MDSTKSSIWKAYTYLQFLNWAVQQPKIPRTQPESERSRVVGRGGKEFCQWFYQQFERAVQWTEASFLVQISGRAEQPVSGNKKTNCWGFYLKKIIRVVKCGIRGYRFHKDMSAKPFIQLYYTLENPSKILPMLSKSLWVKTWFPAIVATGFFNKIGFIRL